MKITVITVGKIKEKYLRDAIAEYQKRLSRYCKLELLEVADESCDVNASKAEEDLVKQREAQRILKLLKPDTYLITLEIEGKQLQSEELAEKIHSLGLSGKSHITFVIGGSLGLDSTLCKKADFALSFSKLTFPHQLMRVILLEQIYRSFRIIHGEPYHK